MCEVCGTNQNRNYSHSRNSRHRKLLIQKLKLIRADIIKKKGYLDEIEYVERMNNPE